MDTETDKAAKEARKQHCTFSQMEHLDFSFQKLWHIQNLSGLDGLVKLQLDNNRIDKIENLAHLVGAAAMPAPAHMGAVLCTSSTAAAACWQCRCLCEPHTGAALRSWRLQHSLPSAAT